MSSAPASRPLPAIHEPWSTPERQREAMTFGIWLFLATEVLFFGGLFLFYAAARFAPQLGFVEGARHTDLLFGTANTVVLLTSSLAMAVAERALKEGLARIAAIGMAVTVALALTFLVVKGFEYAQDIRENLIPGPHFAALGPGAQQFWAFYWAATGVHALHVTIGIGAISFLLWRARQGTLEPRWHAMEVTTLYWHFVDVVWVFLYPLLYLYGRST